LPLLAYAKRRLDNQLHSPKNPVSAEGRHDTDRFARRTLTFSWSRSSGL